MSKESLEQFMEKVGSNEELRASVENQLDSDGNISVDALIAFGADNGCDFTAEDLEDSVELSDEELDGVAGGAYEVLRDILIPATLGFCRLEVDLTPLEIERRKFPHPHRKEFKDTTP